MALNISVPHRSLFIIACLVSVLTGGSLAAIYYQSAKIIITPKITAATANQAINISAAITDPDFVRFKLPARVISTEETREQNFTRGSEATFDDYARGTVILYNDQDTEQQLLPKTHLRHEATGVFFLTDTGISIPPHGNIGLTITAKDQGKAGNVAPGKFVVDKLPPYLQQRVYGGSKQEFSGGIAVSKPISEEEVRSAKEKVLASLREELMSNLTSQAGGQLKSELTAIEEIEANLSAPVGSRASEFKINLKSKGQAFIVDENDLLGLTLLKLRSLAGAEQEFLEYDPNSWRSTLIKQDFDRQEAIIECSLAGTFAAKIGPSAFSAANLAGLTAEEVKERLLPMPGVGAVEVTLFPFWVKAVPARPGAVEIVVRSNQ